MNEVETAAEVGQRRRRAHIQIVRIRAEDLRVGEDVGEGKSRLLKDGLHCIPILSASPLGSKNHHRHMK